MNLIIITQENKNFIYNKHKYLFMKSQLIEKITQIMFKRSLNKQEEVIVRIKKKENHRYYINPFVRIILETPLNSLKFVH